MKRSLLSALLLFSAWLTLGTMLSSCKSKDPSMLKIYVRSENQQLLPKAKVIIIGDTKSVPPTMDYVDTLFSDNAGIAAFNLEEFFDKSGKSITTGYFDILVKQGSDQTTGRVRVKRHITVVETITF